MNIKIFALIAFASFAAFAFSAPDVQASGKKNSGQSIGEKGKEGGGKIVPPGQVKRYTRGSKLPADLKFKNIDDLSKWKLKPLAKGEKYIRVDNDILRVADDTQTVVEAVGIVDDLLR